MKIQQFFYTFENVFLIGTWVIVYLGSLGINRDQYVFAGIIAALIALGYKLAITKELLVPEHFYLYLFFLTILYLHSKFMNGNMAYFWLFLSGGLFWLETFNYKGLFSKYFIYFLFFFGILMGFLFFYSPHLLLNLPNLVSLFSPATQIVKHSNIGDLWMIALVTTFFLFSSADEAPQHKWWGIFSQASSGAESLRSENSSFAHGPTPRLFARGDKSCVFYKKYFILILLSLTGIYFLAISFSRAAIVSLAGGVLYIYSRSNKTGRIKTNIFYLFGLLLALFLYMSTFKTVVFSRPYFFQAIESLFKFPLGIGMGNFGLISYNTNLTHNIVLEIASGLGIFSTIFIGWLYLILKKLTGKGQFEILPSAVFLSIFINFNFGTTYIIPSFIWLWFISLGLI